MDHALVSFDLDGALVDTASEISEAANRTLSAMGLERIPVPQLTQLTGHSPHMLLRNLLLQMRQGETAGMDAWSEAAVLRAFDAHYADTVGSSAVPYGRNGGTSAAISQPDRIFDRLGEVADHVLAGRAVPAR
jgi:phosphoglycolate phosphatase